jgi:hypothetical protein
VPVQTPEALLGRNRSSVSITSLIDVIGGSSLISKHKEETKAKISIKANTIRYMNSIFDKYFNIHS